MKKISIAAIILVLTILTFSITTSFSIRNFEKEIEEMSFQIKSEIEHKTLDKGEFDIHYYVSGKENSELIIFLHPAFSDHRAFDKQIDFFSKNYKVITIDMIGHGLSKANKSKIQIDASTEHIKEIMELEGDSNAHLVGVSMGSLMAQYFGLKYPNNTNSLTVLGGYNINKKSEEVAKAQRSSNLGMVFRALFSIKSFRKKTAELSTGTPEGSALFYTSSSHFERKSFMVMQGLQNVIKDRPEGESSYPTLILVGEFDIELAHRISMEWHSENKGSEYKLIKGAGHSANMDLPDSFNLVLKDFIERKTK